ncbi:hypothetical protein OIE82_16330 [Streptomyces althioticus]|uniref:SdpI family protein n=1 Tax=Streptomyces althioticus TaxID=83380 RepID=A0ABZ1Y8A3_9ACTN|nr:hypothetical protein OHA53_19195 [Streptomyces althioticus]
MEIVFCLGIIALAAYMVRSAVMVWRDPHQARIEAGGWAKLGKHGAWAVTRGIAPFAAMFTCLALMTISFVGADAWPSARGPLEAAGTVLFILMLACWLVITSIAVFNRPRLFVPPYLRDKRRL